MVSNELKTRFAAEKLKRGGKVLLPIFKRDHPSEFVNEILREDEGIRQAVIYNPRYRALLEQMTLETFKKYKGVLKGARLVDSWDRVTSAIGLVGDAVGPFTGGAGNIVSALEEIPELIPKAIYAVYYRAKTGDKKAIPYWTAAEAASFIPYVGDAIDMANIYVDRARKMTKEKVKKDFRRILDSGLERRVISNN